MSVGTRVRAAAGSIQLRRGETRWLGLCTLGFVLLTADVMVGGFFSHLDHQVRDAIQPRPLSVPWPMDVVGYIGGVWIGAAIVIVGGIVAGQVLWRFWPLLVGLAVFATCELFIVVVKLIVGRDGPGLEAERENYPGYFPSGHTATTAVSIGIVVILLLTAWSDLDSRRIGVAAQVVGLAMGSLAGVSALLIDTHWLSDVLGGLIIASATLTIAAAVVREYSTRRD